MYKQKWLVRSPSYQAAYAQFCLHFLAHQTSDEIDTRMGALGFPEDLRGHLVALTRTLVTGEADNVEEPVQEGVHQTSSREQQHAEHVATLAHSANSRASPELDKELSTKVEDASERISSEIHPSRRKLDVSLNTAPQTTSMGAVKTLVHPQKQPDTAKLTKSSYATDDVEVQQSTQARPHESIPVDTSPKISQESTTPTLARTPTPMTLFDFDMTELTPRERKLLIDSAGVLGKRGRSMRHSSRSSNWLRGEPGMERSSGETRGARWTRARAQFFDSVIDSWVVSGQKGESQESDEFEGLKQSSRG